MRPRRILPFFICVFFFPDDTFYEGRAQPIFPCEFDDSRVKRALRGPVDILGKSI